MLGVVCCTCNHTPHSDASAASRWEVKPLEVSKNFPPAEETMTEKVDEEKKREEVKEEIQEEDCTHSRQVERDRDRQMTNKEGVEAKKGEEGVTAVPIIIAQW